MKTMCQILVKKHSLFLLFVYGFYSAPFAQVYNMSNTTLNTCSGTHYDPGGTSNYTNGQDFTQTIAPSSAGNYIILTFSAFDVENNSTCSWDYLEVYDGPTTASNLLGRFCGTSVPGPFTASSAGGELTLKFHSDGSSTRAGWTATISCTTTPPPPPPTIILLNDNVTENSCNAKLYDMGGSGSNYTNNQDFTKTIVPDNGGKLKVTFNSFDVESSTGCAWDYLEIYDGPSIGSTLLGRFCGTTNPGPFTSTAANGELTFKFHSDGSTNKVGWDADISCTTGTPMIYSQTVVTQPTISNCYQGFSNQEVIAINVQTTGAANAIDATQFIIKTDGTTNWSTDLTGNVKIYYTGASATFSTGTLFGSNAVASPGSSILVNGTQSLVGGDNYFWLAYDISATATLGNVIDGLCNQVTVNSVNQTPIPSTSPSGSRTIAAIPPSYTRYIGSAAASSNWVRSIIYDVSDNTHVMAISGRFDGQTAGSWDNMIVKVDQAGDTVWTVAYGTASQDKPLDIIKTTDGGFIVVGQSNFNEATAVKLSSTGLLEWRTFINESSNNSVANSVVESSNGSFIMAGKGSSSHENMYVWELDKNTGALQNGGLGYELFFSAAASEVFDIINTSDGGYVVAGTINNTPGVVKLSSTFIIQWQMEWGSTGDKVVEIIENAANDYTVFIDENNGSPDNDFHVMRFTNSANNPSVVWENRYDGTGDEGIEAAVATTGGYYIAGIGNIIGNVINNEGWVMKITTAGTFVWDNYVGQDDVESYAIATAPSGTVVAGLSNLIGTQAFYSKVDQFSYSCSAVPIKPPVITTTVVGTMFNTSRGSFNQNGFGTVVTTPILTKTSGFPNTENCNTVALPIKLASFDVECNTDYVICKWTTYSEINNDYFAVERSVDGFNFETIGIVEGSGTSNAIREYFYIDKYPVFGTSYYRLKQIDFNGKSELFEISATNCNPGNEINLYPNPFNNRLTIVFGSPIETEIKMEIKNYLGQTVLTKFFPRLSIKIELDFKSNLSKGVYFLQGSDNSGVIITRKIIKL